MIIVVDKWLNSLIQEYSTGCLYRRDQSCFLGARGRKYLHSATSQKSQGNRGFSYLWEKIPDFPVKSLKITVKTTKLGTLDLNWNNPKT